MSFGVGVANKDALLGPRGELAARGTLCRWCMHITLSTEGLKVSDRRFSIVESLIRCSAIEGLMRLTVLGVDEVECRFSPELLDAQRQ